MSGINNISFNINLEEFKKSAKQYAEHDFPDGVALGMAYLTKKIQSATQDVTRRNFNLATDWIPKNINAFPKSKGQIAKISRNISKSNKFIARVGGSDRISFMSGHATGAIRRREHAGKSEWTRGKLAVPGPGMKSRRFKNKNGRVKRQYSPDVLLKDYRGPHAPRPGRKKKLAFVMRGKGGTTMIVRRRTKKRSPLEILYFLVDHSSIDKDWQFLQTGIRIAEQFYASSIRAGLKVVARRSPNRKYGP